MLKVIIVDDEQFIAQGLQAVSYTHLDVYKRQDIFFGSMIDKTHSKLGKARPWMLYGYIGCAITLVGIFAIPMGCLLYTSHLELKFPGR